MLHLIPKPVHRAALRIAYRVRHHWRRRSGRPSQGVTVIGKDIAGQILLIRHSYGPEGWFFPGGGMQRGETPEAAARRELREETGCEIAGLKLVGLLEETLSGAPHTEHVFEGLVDDMPRADEREVVEARFFPTHSLPEPLAPRTRVRLGMWQDRR